MLPDASIIAICFGAPKNPRREDRLDKLSSFRCLKYIQLRLTDMRCFSPVEPATTFLTASPWCSLSVSSRCTSFLSPVLFGTGISLLLCRKQKRPGDVWYRPYFPMIGEKAASMPIRAFISPSTTLTSPLGNPLRLDSSKAYYCRNCGRYRRNCEVVAPILVGHQPHPTPLGLEPQPIGSNRRTVCTTWRW